MSSREVFEDLSQWRFSVARAFGIGHWNRPAAARLHRFAKQCGQARTSRPSLGMAGICMHVHPRRGHAARTATSQFQRPLRGNPMPNAFHPRRRLTTLRLHRLAKAAEEAPKTPAHPVLECFVGVNSPAFRHLASRIPYLASLPGVHMKNHTLYSSLYH